MTIKNDISIRLIQDSANYITISGPAKVVENVIPQFQGDTIVLSETDGMGALFVYTDAAVATDSLMDKVGLATGDITGSKTANELIKVKLLENTANGVIGEPVTAGLAH